MQIVTEFLSGFCTDEPMKDTQRVSSRVEQELSRHKYPVRIMYFFCIITYQLSKICKDLY